MSYLGKRAVNNSFCTNGTLLYLESIQNVLAVNMTKSTKKVRNISLKKETPFSNFLCQDDFALFMHKLTKLYIPGNIFNSWQQWIHWIMHHSLFKNNKHETSFSPVQDENVLFLSSVLHIRSSNIIDNDFTCYSQQLKRTSVDKYPVDLIPQSKHTYPKFSENWGAVQAVQYHCLMQCMHMVLYDYTRSVFT